MLDINYIRENKQEVEKAITHKKTKLDFTVEELLKGFDERKQLQLKVEELRASQNRLTDQIKTNPADRENLIKNATEIKNELTVLEDKLKVIIDKSDLQLSKLPNVVDPNMPIGKDDSENVVIRKWGEPKTFDFKVKDHVDIGNSLDILDIDRAGKVTGARFAYLKNEAVLLQFALVNFVFSTLTNKDIVSKIAKQVGSNSDKVFAPNLPPVFIKSEVMKKMDRFEPVEDRFYFEKDELVLVGSAEHTMGSYFMDEVIEEKDLPIRFVGYSTAFRREAGSYGKDTRGIFRVHQFDKLEMECFTTVDDGQSEQDLLVGIQEYLMQQLQLPYQVVDVCIGDTGRPDYRQYDIETWISSQGKYRETHSSDYMTDFQSRRLNTRYKSRNGESKFVYMNDATAFAIGRTLIAILENYQQADGSVLVPEVLQKYTGFTKIEPKK